MIHKIYKKLYIKISKSSLNLQTMKERTATPPLTTLPSADNVVGLPVHKHDIPTCIIFHGF